MATVHERALKAAVDEQADQDPSGVVLAGLWGLKNELNAGVHGWFADAAGQNWVGKPRTIYDAYGFAKLKHLACSGALYGASIEVGSGPGPDLDDVANRALLAGIAKPFSATCVGGHTRDEDGTLEWPETVIVAQFPCEECGRPPVQCLRWELPAGNAPLEVGTTTVSRTILHLSTTGRLARWPYGSKDVYLLALLRPLIYGTR